MDARTYFQSRITDNETVLKRLKKLAFMLSMSRLSIFLTAGLLMYLFLDNTIVVATSGLIGVAGFLFLVARYTDVKQQLEYHKRIQEINAKELAALDTGYESFESGSEFLDGDHFFNQDIDLFGEGSLYQHINRCGTIAGKVQLSKIFNSNDIANVTDKQQAVKELKLIPNWRQNFQVTASMIEKEVETERIVNWMKMYKRFLPKAARFLPFAQGLLALAAIVAYGANLIPGVYLGFVFFLGLAITSVYLKKVNKLYRTAGEMKETFSQYSRLIAAVESEKFEADILIRLKAQLQTDGVDASLVLRKLSKDLDNLDQRNNFIFGFLANGFLLWDMRYSYRIEEWVENNEASIDNWISAISEFEALSSLGNFAFINESYVWPSLNEKDSILRAKDLGHPLLSDKKRIDNSIDISRGNFFIITGANMAGKSTFLRTIALNLVMANCGLPVCAKEFSYVPIKLISSMRTSDSLKDEESYFFSELKRLKFIVDEISRDTYFIILDEILKGTNSKDKAEGSKKFVERLVASKSTGIIATHDLSLCSIADKESAVQNHYFDAQIIDDELHFDYKFKEGICQNMNASFLLKKMEIV